MRTAAVVQFRKRRPSDQRRRPVPETIAEVVSGPGRKRATFRLVERATGSFTLYRSSRRLGTARVEDGGIWSARFDGAGGHWAASAGDGPALLGLVGAFLLTAEALDEAGQPMEERASSPRGPKGRPTAEERLSLEFARRAEANRARSLQAALKELRKRVKPARA
jgi:hypothetical protein